MRVLLIATEEQKNELLVAQQDVAEITWYKDIPDSFEEPPFDACIDLLFENTTDRCALLTQLRCSLVVVNEVETPNDLLRHDFVRINGWPGFLNATSVEATGLLAVRGKVSDVFNLLGKNLEWIPAEFGFVAPRIIILIINEAFMALEEGLSSAEEIDIAMKMGTNYPYGPFEWCRKIGIKRVYSLLSTLENKHERYRPSRLLKEQALA